MNLIVNGPQIIMINLNVSQCHSRENLSASTTLVYDRTPSERKNHQTNQNQTIQLIVTAFQQEYLTNHQQLIRGHHQVVAVSHHQDIIINLANTNHVTVQGKTKIVRDHNNRIDLVQDHQIDQQAQLINQKSLPVVGSQV
jgi:hypothetical protein